MLCFTCVLPQKGGRVAPKAIKISSDIWKYCIFRSPDICIDMRYQSSSYLLEFFLNAQQFVIFTVSLPANFLFFPSDIDLIVSSLLYLLLLLSLFFILRVKFYHWPYQ